MATKPWPDSIVDGAAGHSLCRVKPRQGRFSTLLPLTLCLLPFFMVATSAVRWWLTARSPHSWFVVSTRTHANGPADVVARDFSLLQKFSR